uniref:RWD domain-containing protein n=1 Tax=Amphimedon queenslandica TaxID=400682 RepID=A0A1X7UN40_AMPQE
MAESNEVAELQQEENEVLLSIYEGDDCFKNPEPLTFQYKIGEAGQSNSFLVEVKWTQNYPEEIPEVSMDSFFNNHLSHSTKSAIKTALLNEASSLIGSPMTYTLFEYAKENQDELVVKEPEEEEQEECEARESAGATGEGAVTSSSKSKPKVHLSKAAKRRQADKLNSQKELPRGHDWVDIIKLSQTGHKSAGPISEPTYKMDIPP